MQINIYRHSKELEEVSESLRKDGVLDRILEDTFRHIGDPLLDVDTSSMFPLYIIWMHPLRCTVALEISRKWKSRYNTQ